MHSHVTSYPYPTVEQAGEALPVVLAKLRGEDVELGCLVHCGYVASGFALSMLLPHKNVIGYTPQEATPGLMAQYTEVLARCGDEKGIAAAIAGVEAGANFPWLLVFDVVKKLLELWLK